MIKSTLILALLSIAVASTMAQQYSYEGITSGGNQDGSEIDSPQTDTAFSNQFGLNQESPSGGVGVSALNGLLGSADNTQSGSSLSSISESISKVLNSQR